MRFPFDARARLIFTAAQIRGPLGEHEAKLMLDTGASWSMLTKRLLRAIGYDPDLSPQHEIVVTASREERVPVVRVQRFRVLGKERLNFPVLCHDLPPGLQVDGLIGLDFLRRYRLSIDFPSGFVSLRP